MLVVPPDGTDAELGNRVLVVWTGSREAARAVNDAIPLLDRAEQVVMLSLQSPGDAGTIASPPLDIVAHLNAHGMPATTSARSWTSRARRRRC